jgi:hypothetical protein
LQRGLALMTDQDVILDADTPLLSPTPKRKIRLWQRLTSDERGFWSIAFDVLFGIIAPILALYFDPIVFRADYLYCFTQAPPGSNFALAAYLAIALGMLTLAMWLLLARRLGPLTGFVAGILLAGGMFAGGIGVLLLPPISIFFGSGVLGPFCICFLALPLFTAITYARNGVRAARRAYRSAQTTRGRTAMTASMILGAVLVLGLPALANWQAHIAIHQASEVLVSNPSDSERARAIAKLRQVHNLCLHLCDVMIDAEFRRLWDEDNYLYQQRFEAQRDAFREVTGDWFHCRRGQG